MTRSVRRASEKPTGEIERELAPKGGERALGKRRGGETTAPRALARAVQDRAVTFVLGAGVSKPRGVPDWRELTRCLWQKLRGARSLPAWLVDGREELQRVRDWASRSESSDLAARIALEAPHPLADQIAMELLRHEVRDDRKFVAALRSALYAAATKPGAQLDTLAVLARVLLHEQKAARRRVLRVISFNADDHLETETNRGHSADADPVLWPVSRESGHPRASRGANGASPIPVYHVHGFLPRDAARRPFRDAPDTLVFADCEYWASVASPLTFANRVMAQALHDSTCVFVGLSMHDVNLMRWLGTRYNAVRADVLSQHAGLASARGAARVRDALARHFWVHTRTADPHELIGALLKLRGVQPLRLSDWGAPFQRLMFESFGVSEPSSPRRKRT